MKATRLLFRLLEPVSPEGAGILARRLFLHAPPRRKSSAEELEILARAESFRVRSGDDALAVWRWGRGPAILLVHGWGGSGAQLARFVDPLLDAGFSVIAFDGPGHGRSTGSTTSLVHLAKAVLRVAERTGPIHGAITHSVGGAATALAISRGLEIDRAVFIGPPSNAMSGSTRSRSRSGSLRA